MMKNWYFGKSFLLVNKDLFGFKRKKIYFKKIDNYKIFDFYYI